MKRNSRILSFCILSVALAGTLGSAQASVVVSGTRVIYPASQHDISIQLNNNDPKPALVQSWLDSGDSHQDPSLSTAPFAITPPITRVEAGKKQLLRLTMLSPTAVPTDRESVYWYNMLDIPAQNKAKLNQNTMQVALRTRIKVFYRPEGLLGTPTEAASGLNWQELQTPQGIALLATNPAAYNVSITHVQLNAGGKSYANDNGGMVPPKGSKEFLLKGLNSQATANSTVSYQWVNDYGTDVQAKSRLGAG